MWLRSQKRPLEVTTKLRLEGERCYGHHVIVIPEGLSASPWTARTDVVIYMLVAFSTT